MDTDINPLNLEFVHLDSLDDEHNELDESLVCICTKFYTWYLAEYRVTGRLRNIRLMGSQLTVAVKSETTTFIQTGATGDTSEITILNCHGENKKILDAFSAFAECTMKTKEIE